MILCLSIFLLSILASSFSVIATYRELNNGSASATLAEGFFFCKLVNLFVNVHLLPSQNHITLLRSVWTRTIVFQEYLFKNSKFSVRVVSQQAFVISQYACVVSQYAPFQKQIFLATETALDDAAH